MNATLFGVPASHPSLAAELMLRHKRIGYRRIDLVSAAHRLLVPALGFPGRTVPRSDSSGTPPGHHADRPGARRAAARAIALPDDPERFARGGAGGRLGQRGLPAGPAAADLNALTRDRSTIDTYLEGARIGIPLPIALRTVRPAIAAARHFNRASDAAVRRDLAALPALIDHVDELLARGVIGAPSSTPPTFRSAPPPRCSRLWPTSSRCWRVTGQRWSTRAAWPRATRGGWGRSSRPPG